MPKMSISRLQASLFFAPAILLPMAAGLISHAAWEVTFDSLQEVASKDPLTETTTAGNAHGFATQRAYITFVPDIDVALPANMGRLKVEVAFAVNALHETAIAEVLPQEMSITQSRLVEAALRQAETMAADGRLLSDLVAYRKELPATLSAAVNKDLAARNLPSAVLETLILSWSHAPATVDGSAPPSIPSEP